MKNVGTVVVILYFALIAAGLTGYVKCVVKLCKCDFEPSYKAEIIYGIGAVSGLGVVIGYLDLGK